MATQVIAVSFKGSTALKHIDKVLWRSDQTGKTGTLSRRGFAEWILEHPEALVFTRDHEERINLVKAVRIDAEAYIYSVKPDNTVDQLLRLPRF